MHSEIISSCKEGPQQSLPSKWAEDAKLVVLEKLGSQIQDHFTDFHGFVGNSSARIGYMSCDGDADVTR
jgi:hypothetical protein